MTGLGGLTEITRKYCDMIVCCAPTKTLVQLSVSHRKHECHLTCIKCTIVGTSSQLIISNVESVEDVGIAPI